MRIVLFVHSLVSCWNHGNAHFLRGVVRELMALGHELRVHEPENSWSRGNMVADHPDAVAQFARDFPGMSSTTYAPDVELDPLLDGADVVIVHEWNEPGLVAAIGARRRAGAAFQALFHDTHHRAVSDPDAIRDFELSGYDGILAFGETLAAIYRAWDIAPVHVWHEAADTELFRPPATETTRDGLVWIGNFGDGERTAELTEYLFAPAQAEAMPLDVYGVRYPRDALETLAGFGARYHGWLANARVPETFARHVATVHVPRAHYTRMLPGIPTIRVFEALACGVPLVCAPWEDSEGLFRSGLDFLTVRSGAEMRRILRDVVNDPGLRDYLVARGLETIRARHTCAHRARELIAIVAPSERT